MVIVKLNTTFEPSLIEDFGIVPCYGVCYSDKKHIPNNQGQKYRTSTVDI